MGITLLFLLPLTMASFSLSDNHTSAVGRHDRHKRSLWNFCGVIECACGSACSAYNMYGCYCGSSWFDSSSYEDGLRPIDGIDTCCQAHDECYVQVDRHCSLGAFSTYFDAYKYTCDEDRRVVHCEHTWGADHDDNCTHAICECDRVAAECFAKHRKPAIVSRDNVCPQHGTPRTVARGSVRIVQTVIQGVYRFFRNLFG